MKIHHINCGCMCPVGGAFYDGFSAGLKAKLTCHCLLIETDHDGLVLVDTGFGHQDMQTPARTLSTFFRAINNIQRKESLTALSQIQALGFEATDVRHIILTHLDFDHAGGISDFPHARVHLMEEEINTAQRRHSWLATQRYRPAQWGGTSGWQGYRAAGDRWFGFEAVNQLAGLPPEILMIPLAGHTTGHAGIAIRTDNGWTLHGGDAWFYRGEMHQAQRHCTPGLRFYQWFMAEDNKARRINQQKLRELSCAHPEELTLFCSHDALEFERLATLQSSAGH
ncbi:MBL fold metallo-hydrolase [Erwinia sp. P6884]|uniref:MBL fold metallo-hydrolase n=1 Tax=Erwinia sp. P6884 TaxID=3141450 RepID=UPI00318A9880